MSMPEFLKARWAEFLLLTLSVVSVAQVVSCGFYGARDFRHGPLVACLALLFVLLLFLGARKRRSRVAAAAVFAIVFVVASAVAVATSTSEAPYLDLPGSNVYLVIVCSVVAFSGFLLTRTLKGSMLWFVASAFVCSCIQAFYGCDERAFSALALASSLVLVVYRNYALGHAKAEVTDVAAPAKDALSSIAPVAVAVAASFVLWTGVIAPLSPGVLDIKLITEYRSLPVLELRGTAQVDPVVNTDLKSEDLSEGPRYTTDDMKVDDSADTVIDAQSQEQKKQQAQQQEEKQSGGNAGGQHQAPSEDSPDPEFQAQSYVEQLPAILLVILCVLLLVAAIVAFFLVRRRARTRRLVAMLDQEPAEQVRSIYLFLVERLARLGFKVPPGQTLAEFSWGSARRMDNLTMETKVPFQELTSTYAKVVYGGYEPTRDEIASFVAFYDSFWKAARQHLGNFKYFFKSFRL